MPDNPSTTDSLPTIPRPLNARAKKRAWAEEPVRVWMILTLFILVSLTILVSQYLREGLNERRLIEQGTPASATIIDIDGDADPRKVIGAQGLTSNRLVHLKYADRAGKPIDAALREASRFDGRHVGDTIDIRFDPDHPDVWTDRTEPQPWSARMAVVWMLLPVLILSAAMMLLRRRQMLAVWRDGTPVIATVVDLKNSPIAPRSRVLRFTVADNDDRRVFSTLFPTSAGPIEKGDELVMLRLKSKIIAAEVYVEETGERESS